MFFTDAYSAPGIYRYNVRKTLRPLYRAHQGMFPTGIFEI